MRTYRAFVSYSHRDAAIARRVHGDLERWRIDADLVGRETALGAVPASLRPLFLDRDDFSGGGTLSTQIQRALDDSEFLIVICSPNAAQSHYVNEEIRCFKAMGREDRIIPLIIAGEPGHPDQECFPQALQYRVDERGEMLTERVEPLAADAREQGDGRRRAVAKLVAGLLGLPFDEIAKRAERAQRRRTRVLTAVAASFLLLAIAAFGFAWLSESRRVVAERHYHAALSAADALLGDIGEELIRIEGIHLETTKGVIQRATSIFDDLTHSIPDASELRVSQVLAKMVFAKALAAKGDAQGAIELSRAALALTEALPAYATDPLLVDALLAMNRSHLGMHLAKAGESQAAIALLDVAVNGFDAITADLSKLDITSPATLQVELASAAMMLAVLLANDGQLDAAIDANRKAIALLEHLLAQSPDSWRYRSLLTTVRYSQAERLVKQGKHHQALALLIAVEQSLSDLLALKPNLFQLRTLLGSVQASLASTYTTLGDITAADAATQRAALTVKRLAEADTENRAAQLGHASQLAADGENLAQQGQVDKALIAFSQSQDRLEAMLVASPDDAVRQELLLSLSRATDTLYDHALYVPAEAAARRLLMLRESDLTQSPANAEAIKGVILSLYRLARVVAEKGALAEALDLYQRQLRLEQQLVTQGENRQRFLADLNGRIGLLHWQLSQRATAVPYYEQYIRLLTDLVAEFPNELALRVDLGQALLNLGELQAVLKQGTRARDAFKRCLVVRQALVAENTDNPSLLTDLAWAEARLAEFGDNPVQRWQRVDALLTQADARAPLDDWDEELLTIARIALSAASP